MIANRIPGGVIGKGTEFFTAMVAGHPEPHCIHAGSTYDFDHTPADRKAILLISMKSRPEIERAMAGIAGNDDTAKLKQFVMCRYGALNDEADIDEAGNLSEPEYVPCARRGTCRYEGVGCAAISVLPGQPLSKAETAVFKLVGLADKIIADKLYLSADTVKKHFKNIRNKTGLNTKTEMAIWATQKGII